MTPLLRSFVFCGLMLIAAIVHAADAKSDLDGVWQLVSMQAAGQSLPADLLGQMKETKMHIADGAMTRKRGEHAGPPVQLTIDATRTPKTIDLKERFGTQLGIYAIEKGELKLCFDPLGKRRPTDFKSTVDGGEVLMILKKAE